MRASASHRSDFIDRESPDATRRWIAVRCLLKASVMRALLIVLVSVVAGSPAVADDTAPAPTTTKKTPDKKPDKKPDVANPEPPPRTPGPHDAKVVALLDKLVADPAARDKSTAELAKLAPDALDAIGEWIRREHPTDIADRRKVLVAIKASIPDKAGRFSQPYSSTAKDRKAEDTADWVKDLTALDGTLAGTNEVIADIIAIRLLGAVKDMRSAQVIFDVGFADQSMIYRDECGRNLRKLEPQSIPALTRESLKGREDRRKYATWQLERLDRQDAKKALTAGVGDEALQVAVLDVFRETKHREAVHAVWSYVDHDVPKVRAAARATWMEYITGPPPPPAPRKRLQLPGGKLTKFPKPMWLTYRELADNELRKTALVVLKEDYGIDEQRIDDYHKEVKAQPIDLEAVTKRIFEHYDGERAKNDGAQWQAAKAKAGSGDLASAVGMIDRLLAVNTDRKERDEMAGVYVSYGRQLEGLSKWSEASAVYSKAHGLSPSPRTLAAVHYTLGKSLEASGKDGGPDFRRAVALDPDYAPAKSAAEAAEPSKPLWMLYAAIGAAAVAMLLFGAAMMRRRAT